MMHPSRPSVVDRYPFVSFVVLAYALTWVFSIPFVYFWRVVLQREFQLWLLVFILAPYGPSIAALILVWLRGQPGAVKRLLRSMTIWRVGLVPWLVALFLPATVVAGAVVAAGAGGLVFERWHGLSGLLSVPLFVVGALPFGPLAEELGWRGWFLPRLQSRYRPFVASLIIGAVWTFWHTPMFWFPGAAIPSFLDLSPLSVALYLAQITAEAVILTVLFNHTGGSVLLAIVYHTMFNTAETTLFSIFNDPGEFRQLPIYVWTVGLSWVVALIALAIPGPVITEEP